MMKAQKSKDELRTRPSKELEAFAMELVAITFSPDLRLTSFTPCPTHQTPPRGDLPLY